MATRNPSRLSSHSASSPPASSTSAPNPIRIRPASLSDLDAIVALDQQTFHPSQNGHDPFSRDFLHRCIVKRTSTFLVLESENTLLGDAFLLLRSPRVAELGTLPVAEEYRGRGYARLLIEACQAAAREKGAGVLRLEVRQDNEAAVRLYRKCGFREFGEYEGRWDDGESSLRFEKNLMDEKDGEKNGSALVRRSERIREKE